MYSMLEKTGVLLIMFELVPIKSNQKYASKSPYLKNYIGY